MAIDLYKKRKKYAEVLFSLFQSLFTIENLPTWVFSNYEASLKQINDFQKAVEYENSPKRFAEITDLTGRTAKIISSTEATGDAITKLGPRTSMSIATVLGTTSTGTSMSSLSSIAATNAALAWLGGGIAAANGGGIAGGSLILGLFGPLGWTIAGFGTIGGFLTAKIKNKDKLREVESQIDIIKHDNQIMRPKLIHLYELITRSELNFQKRLLESMNWIKNIKIKDYKKWDEAQKHELEKLFNAVSNTIQLINERI